MTEAFAHLLDHLLRNQPDVGTAILFWLTNGTLPIEGMSCAGIAVTTQFTTENGRPDIEITQGHGQVLIEVKKESPLFNEQLRRYLTTLRSRGNDTNQPTPIRALVFLSRYAETVAPDLAAHVIVRRWYQLAARIEAQCDNISNTDPVSRYLIHQFLQLLRTKGMTMPKATWELAAGVHSLRTVLDLLGEVLAAKAIKYGRTSAWDWIGYYGDNNRWFFGINYVEPSVLQFQNNEAVIRPTIQPRFGTVSADSRYKGGLKWIHRLELESEPVHFFALSQEQQYQAIQDFLCTSLDEFHHLAEPQS